ncbi:hypothetical protein E2562_027263 [Oryza meyeriana var. granulata]|uniref:DUF834 domain-containing protein n=1 Tax=Oryza meyeriana var. granulata TaxID=110450 RepID=A0A6G1C9F5_9ORYZ|nr:hypothetical protein E2562_027263 [Oryza meyeriana var. granulata]
MKMTLPLVWRPTGGAQQTDEDTMGVGVDGGDDAGRGAVRRQAEKMETGLRCSPAAKGDNNGDKRPAMTVAE